MKNAYRAFFYPHIFQLDNLIPQKVGFDAFDFTNCGVKLPPYLFLEILDSGWTGFYIDFYYGSVLSPCGRWIRRLSPVWILGC
nr:MAG TPA: hypothetical protein [Caudoviricetes sp.]